jgi:hypothetical protein
MPTIFPVSIVIYCIVSYVLPGLFVSLSYNSGLYQYILQPNVVQILLSWVFILLFLFSVPLQLKVVKQLSALIDNTSVPKINLNTKAVYLLLLTVTFLVIVAQIASFHQYSFDLRQLSSLNSDQGLILFKRISYLFRPVYDTLSCVISFILICFIAQGRKVRLYRTIPFVSAQILFGLTSSFSLLRSFVLISCVMLAFNSKRKFLSSLLKLKINPVFLLFITATFLALSFIVIYLINKVDTSLAQMFILFSILSRNTTHFITLSHNIYDRLIIIDFNTFMMSAGRFVNQDIPFVLTKTFDQTISRQTYLTMFQDSRFLPYAGASPGLLGELAISVQSIALLLSLILAYFVVTTLSYFAFEKIFKAIHSCIYFPCFIRLLLALVYCIFIFPLFDQISSIYIIFSSEQVYIVLLLLFYSINLRSLRNLCFNLAGVSRR